MQSRSRKAQHEYFNTTRKGIDIVCESLSDKRINLEIGISVAWPHGNEQGKDS